VEGIRPLISRPTTLIDLLDADVTQLAAGKLSSAAVLGSGEVLTW